MGAGWWVGGGLESGLAGGLGGGGRLVRGGR